MTTPQTLRDLAAKAQKGPWGADQDHVFVGAGMSTTDIAKTFGVLQDRTAAYIAAISPDVLTGLLDRLEAAERALGTIDGFLFDDEREPTDAWDSDHGRIDALNAIARIVIDAASDHSHPKPLEAIWHDDMGNLATFGGRAYSWDCPNCGERIVSRIKPPALSQPHSAEPEGVAE